jgi:hypothetical protein
MEGRAGLFCIAKRTRQLGLLLTDALRGNGSPNTNSTESGIEECDTFAHEWRERDDRGFVLMYM